MEEILTPEMKAAVAALGELVKADARNLAIQHAIDAYEHSEELNNLIAEYNTQQDLLADAYAKNEATEEFKASNASCNVNYYYSCVCGEK